MNHFKFQSQMYIDALPSERSPKASDWKNNVNTQMEDTNIVSIYLRNVTAVLFQLLFIHSTQLRPLSLALNDKVPNIFITFFFFE